MHQRVDNNMVETIHVVTVGSMCQCLTILLIAYGNQSLRSLINTFSFVVFMAIINIANPMAT